MELAPRRLVSAGTMTAQLLARRADRAAGRAAGAEEIGRLVEHDAAHGSDLVRTLRSYLANSSSKVRTSEALRLRRQTVHGRLQKIEELIGDVSAPPGTRLWCWPWTCSSSPAEPGHLDSRPPSGAGYNDADTHHCPS